AALVFGGSMTRLALAADSEPLLEATDAAFRLAYAACPETPLGLYEDEATVYHMLSAYEALRSSHRLPAPSAVGATHWRIAYRATSEASSDALLQGGGIPMRTPGSPKAWVLYTMFASDIREFTEALTREGDDVRIYDFYQRAQPAG